MIVKTQPDSLNELAERTGRAKSNLSRTLKTMERYGLVHFEEGPGRQIAPRVDYSGVELELTVCSSSVMPWTFNATACTVR